MKVVLASASPRRKELLARIVKDFIIVPATGEERTEDADPETVACALAEQKCAEVFLSRPDDLVIACDTIVVYGGKILGKPKDGQDAEKTLKMLSGKTHSVITGVCVRCGENKMTGSERTEVTFNELSDDFIKCYVSGGSPMDKAGSYGIQDGGIVKSYKGSYENVVGLPVGLVAKMIEEVR